MESVPVYQPELAASATHWAAHHRRRELFLGMLTVEAIVGNKIAPGLLDQYLGCAGYDGQQTSHPKDPQAADNLWEPVPGDHDAHGIFDQRSKRRSPESWLAKNRNWITATAAGCGLVACALLLHKRANG